MASQPSKRIVAAAWLLLAPGLLLAGASQAEVRRIEAVGAIPIPPAPSRRFQPREEAVQAALKEAVTNVADQFLLDGHDFPEPGELSLDEVLGDDMLGYTTRFRILEDHGKRPVLFSEEEGVEFEYVVVVAVDVDDQRVRSKLEEAGLLVAADGTELRVIRIEAIGLEAYPGYQALVSLLLTPTVGGKRAVPLEFENGRVLLEVETPATAQALIERAVAQAPPGLELVPLASHPGRPRLAVRWSPEAAEPAAPDVSPAD